MVHELVIVACSRPKKPGPVTALELYEGWCVPHLRHRIGFSPVHRERVLILSARHGLVPADRVLAGYDQAMTPERAAELRPETTEVLRGYAGRFTIATALVLLPALYLEAILLTEVAPVVHVITDPVRHWERAAALLSQWGWP